MRITVTVVVIMFELTGALTYILPTMVGERHKFTGDTRTIVKLLLQIVLLVTKAVGDFLGTNGIADEMIRFNGFPFLEKEDHAFNVSGELLTLHAAFRCLRDAYDSVGGDADRSVHTERIGATGQGCR
jgi:hypothetical protein